MTPSLFLSSILDPGLALVARIGGPAPSDLARQLLLTTALQESGLISRYQGSPGKVPGPANGWFQFEHGSPTGGLMLLMAHPAARPLIVTACDVCHVVPEAGAVWRALEGHDLLAVAVARILYWTDPKRLPTTQDAGWAYYLANWNPGRPRPEDWPGNWQAAGAACTVTN